jgi:outer membrane protein assembly factor BamB
VSDFLDVLSKYSMQSVMKYMFKKSVYAVLAIILMLTLTYIVASYFHYRSVSIKSLPAKSFLLFDTGKQIISPPLIYESQLFAQTASSLYAIDLETQRLLWTRDTPTEDLHTIPLIASDGILIAQGKNGKVIALMAKTGQFLWENQPQVYHGTETTFSDGWIEDAQIYNGTIYIAQYSSYLTAYDLNSGEIRWSVDVPDRTILVITIDSNNIFLTTSTSIIQFDIDSGRMLDEHILGTRIHYALNDDDTFYFAKNSDEGISVFALDSRTFQEKWTTSANTLVTLP